MKKRLAAAWLALAVILAGAAPALGAEETTVELTLNGYALVLDRPALARNGTVLVPVEAFLSALGGPVVSSYWGGTPLPGGLLYRWEADGGPVLRAQWYDKTVTLVPGESGAELRDGVLWAPLRPLAEGLGLTVEWTGRAELSYPKRRVEVDSLKDLFLAAAPDTEIVLKPGEYSFADLDPKELEGIDSPYFYVDYDLFDPGAGEWGLGTIYQVVLRDVRDLHILADGARIATPWAYADVWHFENCRRVTLEGGTAVHDVEPGYCMGNCAELNDCRDMVLNSVVLDGSGAYGLYATGCRDIALLNATISHCTYAAAALFDCRDVRIEAGHIVSCGVFDLVALAECDRVRVRECLIEDNSGGALVTSSGSREVVFEDCTFRGNQFGAVNGFGWQSSGGAVFLNCGFDADAFQTFLESRKLSGLIPAGLVMTDENQAEVIRYFDKLDGIERNYVTLLLQKIAAGEPTAASQSCDRENGVYLNACQFCLYDMNLDGFPEFILKTGSCEADFWYTVYTIIDGELMDCGGLSGSHAALYANGGGGFLRYAGHMGEYDITLSALEGTTLVTREIAQGALDAGGNYPELREYGYEDSDQCLEFRDLPTLFLAPKG